MKGLIIKDPWITKILNGEKPWEIRGSNTKIRGTISLIKSGTGLIFGTVDIVRSTEITLDQFRAHKNLHKIPIDENTQLPYPKTFVWTFVKPKWHDEPIPYVHKQGCVIWINL